MSHSGCFYGLADLHQQMDRVILTGDLIDFLINPQAAHLIPAPLPCWGINRVHIANDHFLLLSE